MSAYIYDEALLEKLKFWTDKTEVHLYGPDDSRRLFEIISDMNDDKPLQLPIISLSRRGGYEIINKNSRPLTRSGARTLVDDFQSYINQNAIPISIPYRIDVYCRYYKEADAYMRDIIFNIINHPTFKIIIPYKGVNYPHHANIRVVGDVDDNSGIPERLIPGQFTRLTIDVSVDDAYLWDIKITPTVSFDADGSVVITTKENNIIDVVENV